MCISTVLLVLPHAVQWCDLNIYSLMKLAGLGESEAENCPRLRFMMWTGARLPKEIIGLPLES